MTAALSQFKTPWQLPTAFRINSEFLNVASRTPEICLLCTFPDSSHTFSTSYSIIINAATLDFFSECWTLLLLWAFVCSFCSWDPPSCEDQTARTSSFLEFGACVCIAAAMESGLHLPIRPEAFWRPGSFHALYFCVIRFYHRAWYTVGPRLVLGNILFTCHKY